MDIIIRAIMDVTIVSKCVLFILLFMSISSWAFMCGKWIQLRSAQENVTKGLQRFDEQDGLNTALPILAAVPQSPLFGITRRGVREFNRLTRKGDTERLLNDNMRRALHFGIAEEMGKLKSSLALLATAANTAPFIGLFGTVWGIMFSFQNIARMKSVSLATVAPGIAEALIATAVGLFVAIPAVCGYNIFKSKISKIEGECITFAGQLLNRMQQEVKEHNDGLLFSGEK